MAELHGQPGAPSEQEGADALDEPVNEALAHRAERLPRGRLHRVALRAGEHRVELHEVASANGSNVQPDSRPGYCPTAPSTLANINGLREPLYSRSAAFTIR